MLCKSESPFAITNIVDPLRPPTSAKQAGPWIVAFRNTTGPWRMETLQPLLLPSIVLVRPPGQFVQGHSDRHTPAHQNSLHAAWSPGTANTSGPLSTETGDSARTLCCTVGLTQLPSGFYCANIITILTIILFSTFLPTPPFSLFTPFPFLYSFFLFCFHAFPHFLYSCTSCDHIIVRLPTVFIHAYTCMPVSVNYSLMKTTVCCRNVLIVVFSVLASVSANQVRCIKGASNF